MDLSQFTPALIINPASGIFIGDLFGFILALPVSLFLAFWMSAVKNRRVVVLGAFIGCLIGFLAILAWVGTLIYNTELPGATGAATFFGSVLICSATGVIGGILLDLIVARRTSRYYRRPQQLAHE
jgi:biotin transporter BioY